MRYLLIVNNEPQLYTHDHAVLLKLFKTLKKRVSREYIQIVLETIEEIHF